jgi:hypothetical protein
LGLDSGMPFFFFWQYPAFASFGIIMNLTRIAFAFVTLGVSASIWATDNNGIASSAIQSDAGYISPFISDSHLALSARITGNI